MKTTLLVTLAFGITFATQLATSSEAEAQACVFAAVPPMDFVASGATKNVVWLRASTAACAQSLVNARQLTLATADDASATATPSYGKWVPEADCANAAPATCTLVQMNLLNTSAVSSGTKDWAVTASTSTTSLGTLRLRTAVIETQQVIVSYHDAHLDSAHDGFATKTDKGAIAAAKKFDGAFVAPEAPKLSYQDSKAGPLLGNTADVSVADSIVEPESRNAQGSPRLQWRIAKSTWGKSVYFWCVDEGDEGYRHKDCAVRLDRIRFHVSRRFRLPLIANVQLVDTSTKEVLVSLPLRLAAEARLESLPLPLWLVTSVECQHDRLFRDDSSTTATHGDSIAVDDDALQRGACKLHIDYNDLPKEDPKKPGGLYGLRDVYGQQPLEVTVTRGEKSVTTTFVADPTKGERVVPLPAPVDARKEEGPYTVRVRLESGLGDTHFRTGSIGAEASASNPEEHVELLLRPRGTIGLTYPFRLYITFPVTPVTLRTPPRADSLMSSDDSPIVQLDSVRAGAMFVLEPWNYDENRNLLPIPVSFQLGVSFVKLEKDPIDKALLMGLSIDFPIIDKTVTESSIAIGAFYEVSLEESGWRDHDAFIVTLGFDFLRLAKTNQESE